MRENCAGHLRALAHKPYEAAKTCRKCAARGARKCAKNGPRTCLHAEIIDDTKCAGDEVRGSTPRRKKVNDFKVCECAEVRPYGGGIRRALARGDASCPPVGQKPIAKKEKEERKTMDIRKLSPEEDTMNTKPNTFETGYCQGLQVAAQLLLEVHATASVSGWESEADRLQAFQALLAIAAEECRAVRADEYMAARRDDGSVDVVKRPPEPVEFFSVADLIREGETASARNPQSPARPWRELPPATWEELCELEPRLANLLRMAESIRDLGGRYYCSAESWYMVFKPALTPLVGWERGTGDARLRTSEAWDLCCRKLQRALPDCRDCNCF